MRLFHGSNQLITQIDLSKSKDFKDFGRGFYMTRDYARAVTMAQRTATIEGTGNPEVTPFLFYPNRCPDDVRICVFKERSPEWALFVLNNRDKQRLLPFSHEFDIVIGPVADSRVDTVLCAYKERYETAYSHPENLRQLADQLKYPGPEYIQYCFCTQKGIEQLILDI